MVVVISDTLLSLMAKSREVNEFLKSCKTLDNIRPTLLRKLGLDELMTPDGCFNEFINTVSENDLLKIAQILGTGATTFQKNGQKLAEWLALSHIERQRNIDLFADAFFNNKGDVRSVGKKIAEAYPEVLTLIDMALAHYYTFKDRLACLTQAQQTTDLLIVIQKCLAEYTARKRQLNVLDFNDLILKTRKLFYFQINK
jgi:ATP-dependent exoDNAse (exonuclease V) beta subunit